MTTTIQLPLAASVAMPPFGYTNQVFNVYLNCPFLQAFVLQHPVVRSIVQVANQPHLVPSTLKSINNDMACISIGPWPLACEVYIALVEDMQFVTQAVAYQILNSVNEPCTTNVAQDSTDMSFLDELNIQTSSMAITPLTDMPDVIAYIEGINTMAYLDEEPLSYAQVVKMTKEFGTLSNLIVHAMENNCFEFVFCLMAYVHEDDDVCQLLIAEANKQKKPIFKHLINWYKVNAEHAYLSDSSSSDEDEEEESEEVPEITSPTTPMPQSSNFVRTLIELTEHAMSSIVCAELNDKKELRIYSQQPNRQTATELIRGKFIVDKVEMSSINEYLFTTRREITADKLDDIPTVMNICVKEDDKLGKWNRLVKDLIPMKKQNSAKALLKSISESHLPDLSPYMPFYKPNQVYPSFVETNWSNWAAEQTRDWLCMFDYKQKGVSFAETKDFDGKSVAEKTDKYSILMCQLAQQQSLTVEQIRTILKDKVGIQNSEILDFFTQKLNDLVHDKINLKKQYYLWFAYKKLLKHVMNGTNTDPVQLEMVNSGTIEKTISYISNTHLSVSYWTNALALSAKEQNRIQLIACKTKQIPESFNFSIITDPSKNTVWESLQKSWSNTPTSEYVCPLALKINDMALMFSSSGFVTLSHVSKVEPLLAVRFENMPEEITMQEYKAFCAQAANIIVNWNGKYEYTPKARCQARNIANSAQFVRHMLEELKWSHQFSPMIAEFISRPKIYTQNKQILQANKAFAQKFNLPYREVEFSDKQQIEYYLEEFQKKSAEKGSNFAQAHRAEFDLLQAFLAVR